MRAHCSLKERESAWRAYMENNGEASQEANSRQLVVNCLLAAAFLVYGLRLDFEGRYAQ